jgi:tetratricopeptide (TPR) repeat protein
MELVRREMLQTALGFAQRFLIRHGDQPELRFQVNLARLRVGEIEGHLGNLEASEVAYRDAISGLDALPPERNADKHHRREHRLALATAWNDLALLLQTRRRANPALEAMERAVHLRRDLEKDFPEDREVSAALAQAYNNYGDMLQVDRKIAEAERAYGQARDRFEALTKRFSLELGGPPRKGLPQDEEHERLDYAQMLARTYANLGTLWTGRDATKAGQAYEKAVALVRALAKHYPDLPYLRQELARALLNRGTLRHVSGQANEADADYKEATRLLARLAAEFRSVPDYRRLLSNVYFNHGQLLRAANEPRQAEKVWRLLLPVAKELTEDFRGEAFLRERLGRTYNELGIALTQQNQCGPAEKAFGDAVAVLEPLVAKPPVEASAWQALAESHANLTSVAIVLSPAKEAEARARASVAVSQRWAKAYPGQALSHESVAEASIALADYLIARRRKPAEGVPLLEQAAVSLARCLPLAERPQDREGYATRAMKALERAVEHGYRDVNRLRTLPEFKPLRGRADFRKLLARLEQNRS